MAPVALRGAGFSPVIQGGIGTVAIPGRDVDVPEVQVTDVSEYHDTVERLRDVGRRGTEDNAYGGGREPSSPADT